MRWTTKQGEQLEVKDMGTSHIENCLAMLKRKGYVSPSEVELFLFGGVPNGDMAQLAWEQAMDEVFSAPVAPIIDEFEKELKERNHEQ